MGCNIEANSRHKRIARKPYTCIFQIIYNNMGHNIETSSRNGSVSPKNLQVFESTHEMWYTVTWDIILRRVRATIACCLKICRCICWQMGNGVRWYVIQRNMVYTMEATLCKHSALPENLRANTFDVAWRGWIWDMIHMHKGYDMQASSRKGSTKIYTLPRVIWRNTEEYGI